MAMFYQLWGQRTAAARALPLCTNDQNFPTGDSDVVASQGMRGTLNELETASTRRLMDLLGGSKHCGHVGNF